MTNSKPRWAYFTENGSRKRKLKVASFTGIEAKALYDAHEQGSADLMSSFRNGVFEFYLEETLDEG